LLLLVGATAAVWFAVQHYEIRGIGDIALVSRDGGENLDGIPDAPKDKQSIRIASFNLQDFGPAKAGNAAAMEIIARVIREFDVVAIQDICSPRPDVLRTLIDRVNDTGRHYSILVGPEVGRGPRQQRFVYVFDQVTIETDRSAAYTVDDPDDLLNRSPWVGWFRTRGPAPDKAFTFTLVNVFADPDEVQYEMRHLDAVYYEVRDDGRGEDDLIMLGSFHAADHKLGDLQNIPTILAAISETTTNTLQTEQLDNLVFQLSATSEYAGRSGVFDFMRQYNLTLDQALQVSNHLPVWAEFSTIEGGSHPVVAAHPGVGFRSVTDRR
jgi:hypothetical protein